MLLGLLLFIATQAAWAANLCADALKELRDLYALAEDVSATEGERMTRLAALRDAIERLRAQGVDPALLASLTPAGFEENGASTGAPVTRPAPSTAAQVLPAADARDLRGLLLREVLATAQGEALESALIRGKNVSFRFVSIPPGTYTMGSPATERGRMANENQRVVTITEGFELQATPVTVGQIMAWMRVTGVKETIERRPRFQDFRDQDAFAEFFSASEVDAYVAWLNSLPGVVESGCRYAVPSEEEWEWALRMSVGDPARYQDPRPFLDAELNKYVFHRDNSSDIPVAVALKKPLRNGLYDMLGSVWQWTSSTQANGDRVLRGGSGFTPPEHLRSAYRTSLDNKKKYIDNGLRLSRRCGTAAAWVSGVSYSSSR